MKTKVEKWCTSQPNNTKDCRLSPASRREPSRRLSLRASMKNQPYWHLDFRLVPSRLWENEVLLSWASQYMGLCFSSPGTLMCSPYPALSLSAGYTGGFSLKIQRAVHLEAVQFCIQPSNKKVQIDITRHMFQRSQGKSPFLCSCARLTERISLLSVFWKKPCGKMIKENGQNRSVQRKPV